MKMFAQLYIKYMYLLLGSHTSKSVNKSPTRLAADGLGPLTPAFDGAGRSVMMHLSAASLFLSEIVIALVRKWTNTTSKTFYSVVYCVMPGIPSSWLMLWLISSVTMTLYIHCISKIVQQLLFEKYMNWFWWRWQKCYSENKKWNTLFSDLT